MDYGAVICPTCPSNQKHARQVVGIAVKDGKVYDILTWCPGCGDKRGRVVEYKPEDGDKEET